MTVDARITFIHALIVLVINPATYWSAPEKLGGETGLVGDNLIRRKVVLGYIAPLVFVQW